MYKRTTIIALSLMTLYACSTGQQGIERTVDQGKQTDQSAVTQVIPENPPASLVKPAPESEVKRAADDSAMGAVDVRQKSVQAMPMMERVATFSAVQDYRIAQQEPYRENYAAFDDNPVKRAAEQPVSTFSVDVDTGAYSNVRRFLNQGRLPDKNAVRTEELINYFSYNYPVPDSMQQPFSVTTEVAPTPWNEHSLLLHVGLQAYDIPSKDLPPANLVFLVDVSGSMQNSDKLGLLKSGLKLLVKQLDKDDRISIVVYAGASGVVLEPTGGDQKATIERALDELRAGGSTNGGAGIRLAYQMARQHFIKDGINRILLATDGDFNVGVSDFESLKQMVEKEREHGVALSTLGFGTGNYNDHLMEQLADAGNGNYSYIDNLNEARKVLVEELGSTLQTVAKDVKIQVEFNPAVVAEYRLIGYENRALKREDFNNDKVDAGDIGAGHSVTALYEIQLAGEPGARMDKLRYAQTVTDSSANKDELLHIKLRYKKPVENNSQLISKVVKVADVKHDFKSASEAFRFSSAVAAFGQALRGGQYIGSFDYDKILAVARDARGQDASGYRGEFIQLISLAKSLN